MITQLIDNYLLMHYPDQVMTKKEKTRAKAERTKADKTGK